MIDLFLESEGLLTWTVALLAVAAIVLPYLVAFRRRARRDSERKLEAARLGIDRAIAQFPFVDEALCVGCAGCVDACPEGDVLGVVGGTAVVVNGLRCIGHSLCEDACPVGAIEVGLGDLKSRTDIPVLNDFETNIPGVFIAGELGGMALIRVAVDQGRQVVERIMDQRGGSEENVGGAHDLVVVGCGPAGISAALAAKQHGLDCVLLDQESHLGGSLLHYPRRKLVLTQPASIPLWGTLERSQYSKEELLEIFQDCLTRFELDARFSQKVLSIEPGNGSFAIRTQSSELHTRRVVLALGRRGTPRKLGVPGEEYSKVMYKLKDAEAYRDAKVVVVGGGDSAAEAAIGLSRVGGNEVTLSYRREKLVRIKKKNQDRIDRLIGEGAVKPQFESAVRHISPDQVVLNLAGRREVELENDYVFVFVGGEPPFGLLRKMGVQFGGDPSPA